MPCHVGAASTWIIWGFRCAFCVATETLLFAEPTLWPSSDIRLSNELSIKESSLLNLSRYFLDNWVISFVTRHPTWKQVNHLISHSSSSIWLTSSDAPRSSCSLIERLAEEEKSMTGKENCDVVKLHRKRRIFFWLRFFHSSSVVQFRVVKRCKSSINTCVDSSSFEYATSHETKISCDVTSQFALSHAARCPVSIARNHKCSFAVWRRISLSSGCDESSCRQLLQRKSLKCLWDCVDENVSLTISFTFLKSSTGFLLHQQGLLLISARTQWIS